MKGGLYDRFFHSMAQDEIKDLSDEDIYILFRSIESCSDQYNVILTSEGFLNDICKSGIVEKRSHLIGLILSLIQSQAESEEIDYKKPYICFIRYIENQFSVIAEVLKKVRYDEYIIHAYSLASGPKGEQKLVNLDSLRKKNESDRITEQEFNRQKKGICDRYQDKEALQENSPKWKSFSFQDEMLKLIDETKRIQGNELKNSSQKKKVPYDILKELLSDYDQGGNPENSLLNEHIEKEVFINGQLMAGLVIKSGVKKFQDFVTIMVNEFGDSLVPFLKEFYTNTLLWPAIDKRGMESRENIEKFDLDSFVDELFGRNIKFEYNISSPMMIRTHLTWMEEYDPEKLFELYYYGTLRDYLNTKLEEATRLRQELIMKGRDESMAMEVVNANILAPYSSETDIPLKKRKINKTLINKIWASLADIIYDRKQ